jgi:poly(A) polymerase
MSRRSPQQGDNPSPAQLTGNPTIIPRHLHTVSRSDISDNALKVLTRLNKAGYQAYLVGGSVRDLLLRQAPKDFDVATDARPEQIYKLFRNSRLIGRRFRLAHIQFGREIIEVATFRREGKANNQHRQISQDGMILRDNVYGTLEDDAKRRDFTINALYYDSKDCTIIDYTDGFADIESRTLRVIGDPSQRYAEDPVRMLRAIRFQSKLNFKLDHDTAAPIATLSERLQLIPHARLFEETLKIFQHKRAHANYEALEEHGIFAQLFPIIAEYRQHSGAPDCHPLIIATLKNTEQRIANQRPVNPAFLFAAILWHPLLKLSNELKEAGSEPLVALEQAMDKIIHRQVKTTAIPKRFVAIIREIWLLQYRLPRRHGKRAFRVLQHPRFRAGYDFLLLRAQVGEEANELVDWWTEFQTADEAQQEDMLENLRRRKRRRKRPQPDQSNDSN